MKTGKVILGTLAGLAIGAITGILLAPEKGSTTRKQMLDKGDDFFNDLKSKINEFVDSLTKKFETTKNDLEDLSENGKTKYSESKKVV